MTDDEIVDSILQEQQFHTHHRRLRGKIPYAGEFAISSGTLTGPPRSLFLAELEFQTLRYVVISEHTPILWRGAFQWIMPPRLYAPDVSDSDYLLMLETIDKTEEQEQVGS